MLRGYSSNKVIGVLRGGLGNQLFQLVAYLAIARFNRKPLALDVGTFSHPSQVSLGRKLEIEGFADALGFTVLPTSGFQAVERLRSSCVWAVRTILDLTPLDRFGPLLMSEKRALGKLPEAKLQGLRLIDGYFADVWGKAVFQDTLEEIIVQLSQAQGHLPAGTLEKYSSFDLTVHMRLGDMVAANEALLGDLDRALAEVANEHGARILIFSDQPQLAEMILQSHGLSEFEFAPMTWSSLETLLVMSLANRLYCSPSTFSWWAGVVASSNGGVVYYPKLNAKDSELMTIPDSWVRF